VACVAGIATAARGQIRDKVPVVLVWKVRHRREICR
jgi:hypothetical protein